MCPLYRGMDPLIDWNPTNTIAQHARWPTLSPATQQLATILKQTEVAGSASTTQSPYMGQLLKTGLFSLFSAPLVPFATFH